MYCLYRVLQIKELVRDCLQQKDVEVKIEPTTREEPAPLLLKRSACVDASAFSPLRKLVSRRRIPDSSGGVIITTQTDDFGTKEQLKALFLNSASGRLCARMEGKHSCFCVCGHLESYCALQSSL